MTSPATSQKQALSAFIAKKKFLPEEMYTGVMTEPERQKYEALINALATGLLPLADMKEPKPALMAAFKAAYPDFDYADTEDRERALGYFEELMAILGVESSDGLLNKLMYGFNLSQSVDERNQEAIASMSAEEKIFAATLNGLTRHDAAAVLQTALGRPMIAQATIKIWTRGGDDRDMVSLSEESGKTALIWMIKGRFMFSRLL